MTYEQIMFYITIAFLGLAVLITVTNILTQLFKKIIDRETFPAQAIVFLIAEILSFLAVAIICTIAGIVTYWYFWVCTFLLGCAVAYGAIFGYDNLYSQLFTALKNIIKAIFNKTEG